RSWRIAFSLAKWHGRDKLVSSRQLRQRNPMKRRVLATLLVVFVCAVAAIGQTAPAPGASADISSLAPPAHPASEAQIREYLTLTHTIETAHQIIKDELRTSRTTSAPYFTSGFWDDMEAALMQIDLVPYFVPAYQ